MTKAYALLDKARNRIVAMHSRTLNTLGLKLRRFGRSIGFDSSPQTMEELIEAVCLYHDRYFRTFNGREMQEEERWGGHGGVFVPRVTLRMAGKELGWIEDVEIRGKTAYFGHFAIVQEYVGRGLAQAMIQSYIRKLIQLYSIDKAVFDNRRTRGELGNYESFFVKSLGAVQSVDEQHLFVWQRPVEEL